MHTTSTALRRIALHWADLHQALDAQGHSEWPPAGRMSDYLRALDDADAAELRLLDRDPRQIGATRAPLRIDVLDTMRLVQGTLVHIADTVAADVQHATMNPAPADWLARGYTVRDKLRRDKAAAESASDPRRWRYTGLRTAPYAALWLCARIEHRPGPCTPLTPAHAQQIAAVAAGCLQRVEQALGLHTREDEHGQPCPDCGGPIQLRTGAGAPPMARCGGCERLWTMADTVAA